MRKIIGNQRGSFVVDVFLLPLIGIFQAYVMVRYFFKHYDKKSTKVKLTVLVVAIFWPIALGLYYDIFSFQFLAPGMTGNDFMWNWPLLQLSGNRFVPLSHIPTYAVEGFPFLNRVAFYLFLVVYPIMYFFGVQVGYVLFGRSPNQKGGIDLVFPRKEGDKDNFN